MVKNSLVLISFKPRSKNTVQYFNQVKDVLWLHTLWQVLL